MVRDVHHAAVEKRTIEGHQAVDSCNSQTPSQLLSWGDVRQSEEEKDGKRLVMLVNIEPTCTDEGNVGSFPRVEVAHHPKKPLLGHPSASGAEQTIGVSVTDNSTMPRMPNHPAVKNSGKSSLDSALVRRNSKSRVEEEAAGNATNDCVQKSHENHGDWHLMAATGLCNIHQGSMSGRKPQWETWNTT